MPETPENQNDMILPFSSSETEREMVNENGKSPSELSESGESEFVVSEDGERAVFSGQKIRFHPDFFSETEEENSSLTKIFEEGFHSVFPSESEEPVEPSTLSLDEDLSDEERFQREEAISLAEHLDEVLRQEDKETLFELGAKYEQLDPFESIEEPRSAEVSPISLLEAMLFVGDRQNRPLELEKAVELMRNVSVEEAKNAIEELNRRYDQSGTPYRIESENNGYQLVLRPEFEPVRDRFFGKTRDFKLSQKAIDVLALIAYRQPISAAELASFRSGTVPILSLLLKRGLIEQEKKIVDKKQFTYYRTTPRFLQVMNIESLDDLPIVEEIDYR